MKLHRLAVPATLLITALGLGACETDDELGSQEAASTEVALETESTHEPLGSHTLKKKMCQAIVAMEGVAEHDGQCGGFAFTITELGRSTVYGYLEDARPVTMRMKVAVENPANGATYDATLTRALNDKFKLEFSAEIAPSTLTQIHAFIRDLADAAGEYGDFEDDDVAPHVKAVAWDDVPAAMQAVFEAARADQALENCWEYEMNGNPDDCPNGASISDEHGVQAIVLDGEQVGWILGLWDYIDHPLWDGSGVHIYYDDNGTEVESVSWSG